MPDYEYKVVPAPSKGEKAKGVRTPEARFAHALERMMNSLAAEGWEYLRADMLPSEERQGLTGSATHWRNVLIFRRAKPGSLDAFQPRSPSLPDELRPDQATAPAQSATNPHPAPPARPEPPLAAPDAAPPHTQTTAAPVRPTTGITAALRARAEAAADKSDDQTAEPKG